MGVGKKRVYRIMDRPPPVLRTGLLGGEGPMIDKNSPLGKRLLGLVFVLVILQHQDQQLHFGKVQ